MPTCACKCDGSDLSRGSKRSGVVAVRGFSSASDLTRSDGGSFVSGDLFRCCSDFFEFWNMCCGTSRSLCVIMCCFILP